MLQKTFFLIDHQGKGQEYALALTDNGWKPTTSYRDAEICLVDSDVTPLRIQNLQKIANAGCKIFVYPHAARPNLFYDYPGYKPFDGVTAQFVSTETHKKVLEIIGYPKPVYSVGWTYCPILPFQPSLAVRNVLFAPIHANGNGWLSEEDKDINRRTMNALLGAKKERGFNLTVRFLRDLESCGLKQEQGVSYICGSPNQSYEQIDQVDLVISHETFAWITIARGKPTLMMAENIAPRYGSNPDTYNYVTNWDKYKDLIMYPYYVLSGEDVHCLMEKVSQKSNLVEDWKTKMIGKPFSPVTFLNTIESYAGEVSVPSKV